MNRLGGMPIAAVYWVRAPKNHYVVRFLFLLDAFAYSFQHGCGLVFTARFLRITHCTKNSEYSLSKTADAQRKNKEPIGCCAMCISMSLQVSDGKTCNKNKYEKP